MLEDIHFMYLGIWSLVGSILGFFSFTYNNHHSVVANIRKCILSVSVGVFMSIPLTIYLLEQIHYSVALSILLGGLSAFGLPNIIFKYYNIIIDNTVLRMTGGTLDINTSLKKPKRKRIDDE